MFEFQSSPDFYKNPSSLSLFCVSFRGNNTQGSLCFFSIALLSCGGNRLKCLDGGSLDLGFFWRGGVCLFLFCFSFKNLTSIDLPENLGRFLLLDILKIRNYGVYVSFLKFFPLYFYM